MKNIILFYLVTQLISTAYGLSVIESVRPIIKAKLEDKGYVQKNKNSLYKYNEKLGKVLKGFIPFYYAISAVNLISGKNAINKAVNKEISDGEYITREDAIASAIAESEKKNAPVPEIAPEIVFEKPEKYTARKNDVSLFDTYITPIEYATRESNHEDDLSISPFMDSSKVVEHVVLKEDVTKSDIVKAISELNSDELMALNTTISTLADMKKNKENKYLSLKDVA